MHIGLLEVCNSRIYRVIAAGFDLVSLFLAWQVTMYLRVLLNPVMHFQLSRDQIERLAPPLGGFLMAWVIASVLVNVLSDDSIGEHLLRIVQMWGLGSTLLTALTLMSREMGEELSRSFVLLF